MNGVVYWSNTGQSRLAAAYLAERLQWPCFDMADAPREFGMLILIFPVHCQRIPDAVADFLKRVRAQWLVPIATYGRMCHGDVLRQLQRRYGFAIAASAYLPAKHSYLPDSSPVDRTELDRLLPALKHPVPVRIPQSRRNPLSDLFPALRSRLGVVLERTGACNGCGICGKHCPVGTMGDGIPGSNCIRCLRCAALCPRQALRFRLRWPMRCYLRKANRAQAECFLPTKTP